MSATVLTSEEAARLWGVCLHESGHCVAAVVESVGVEGVYAGPDGGYATFCPNKLRPHAGAIAFAAGLAAEELLAGTPCPPMNRRQTTKSPEQTTGEQERRESDHHLSLLFEAALPDWVRLAHWASEHPDVDAWPRRYYSIRAQAALLVSRHSEAIARLAEAIFNQGALTEGEIMGALGDSYRGFMEGKA